MKRKIKDPPTRIVIRCRMSIKKPLKKAAKYRGISLSALAREIIEQYFNGGI